MPKSGVEKRNYHALRAYIDGLFASGASLSGRDPFRLIYNGRLYTVNFGMLIAEDITIEQIDATPVDHEPAAERCLEDLDQAIKAGLHTVTERQHQQTQRRAG